MQGKKYSVVSCQLHSELELAIMHNESISVEVDSQTLESQRLVVKPYDIVTRKNKGEFLLAKDGENQAIEIRLDQIKTWQTVE